MQMKEMVGALYNINDKTVNAVLEEYERAAGDWPEAFADTFEYGIDVDEKMRREYASGRANGAVAVCGMLIRRLYRIHILDA